jgi:sporulation protein YlmC with PRC-barrel domain
MLKKLMVATAVGGLMVSAAAAQTPDASNAAASVSPNVVASQSADQWLASKFKGTDVLGSDNEKIGDVSDILFDNSGKIEAYVISVGGFLGLGAKEVALAPSAFQIVKGDSAPAATTGAGNAASTPRADADEIKLKTNMSKDQLKSAANFEHYRNPNRATTGAAGTRPAPAAGR